MAQQLASSAKDDRDVALEALSDMHVDVTDDLIALMTHDHANVREFAAFALSQQVPISHAIVPTFTRVFLDEEETDATRGSVGRAFQRIAEQSHGPPNDSQQQVIAVLRQAIRSDNAIVARHAAQALEKFGPAAVSAEADLLQLWADNSTIDVGAALCSIRPGQHNSMFLSFLIAELTHVDKAEDTWILHYFVQLGTDASDAIPHLKKLSKPQPNLAHYIDDAIQKIQSSK